MEEQLGFEVGGIGPFPVNNTIKIIIDQALTDIGMIFCGSGKNTVTIEMDISDLVKLVNPVIWENKKGIADLTASTASNASPHKRL